MNQSIMVITTNNGSLWATGTSTLLLTFALFSLSCNSSDIATRNDADVASSPLSDSTDSDSSVDTATSTIVDIVTGPDTSPQPVGLTLGERLKQLDERMKVAPADSLEILMTEYDRLLDSAITGKISAKPQPESTSSETTSVAETLPEKTVPEQNSTPPAEEKSYVTMEEIASEESNGQSELSETPPRNPASSTPRSEIVQEGSNVLVQSTFQSEYESSTFDPSQYQGARQSELKYYNENKNKSSSQSGTSAKSSKGSSTKSSKTSSNSGRTSTAASKPSTTTSTSPSTSTSRSRTPERSTGESLDEKYSNGLTYFRAGSYSKAIENLQPVASSSKSYRNTARFYYALALERTGSLSQAASQFRKLKGGSGSLADKAWIAYARTLQRQGQSGQAKKELLSFIKSRPKSGQIGSARELLQKL